MNHQHIIQWQKTRLTLRLQLIESKQTASRIVLPVSN